MNKIEAGPVSKSLAKRMRQQFTPASSVSVFYLSLAFLWLPTVLGWTLLDPTFLPESPVVHRRLVLGTMGSTAASLVLPSMAAAEEELIVRNTPNFAYSFRPPADFERYQKPVKTHLEESNFRSKSLRGYEIGITVDPVRIQNLKQFGTPEEVAARVVTAEVNRDGVFEVTLIEDPAETADGAYALNYLSKGKRGDKRFLVKILIDDQKLYVVTGQVKEENYPEYESELKRSVGSFRVTI